MRKEFLHIVQQTINNYEYAVIKPTAEKLDEWSDASDIDIAIDEPSAIKIWEDLEKNELVKSIRAADKSFMFQLYFILKDESQVAIDFIFQFKHKQHHLMSLQEMLEGKKQTQSGLWVMDKNVEMEFIWLFYLMNMSEIPQKYILQFESFSNTQKSELLLLFAKKYSTTMQNFTELFSTKNLYQVVAARVYESSANKGFQGFVNKLNYYLDIGNEFFQWDGIVVTFSGVDGAGKSTVIENLQQEIDKKLRRKTVVIRHRPSMLPIINAWFKGKEKAEALSASTLPRQGKNTSLVSSFIRFVYYYSDYFVGQFYVQLKYVSRGYVVLYDRYYFDFINDSKRSNIQLSKGFVKWFYKFLLKPDLNFFLTAPAEDILKRKQELSAETINELTSEYKNLFAQLQSKSSSIKYELVNNILLNETIEDIFKEIKIALN